MRFSRALQPPKTMHPRRVRVTKSRFLRRCASPQRVNNGWDTGVVGRLHKPMLQSKLLFVAGCCSTRDLVEDCEPHWFLSHDNRPLGDVGWVESIAQQSDVFRGHDYAVPLTYSV